MTKKSLLLSLILSSFSYVLLCSNIYADDSTTARGYTVLGGVNEDVTTLTGKSKFVNCTKSGYGDQSICEDHYSGGNATCELVSEASGFYMCQPMGEHFCFLDEDCTILGKSKCVIKKGSNVSFPQQFDTKDDATSQKEVIGICAAVGGGAEDNAFGQAICNLMGVVQGTAGRAVVGVVVIVVGIMFFLGKVTWSLVLAIALGAGAIFGTNAIVKLVTGEQIGCSK